MSVTQKQIGEMLGLTHASVSRSLKDDPRISVETRSAVKRLAQELGYRPNLIARSLRGGCTDTIGIIWPLTGAAKTTEAIHLLSSKFFANGFLTSIVDSLGLGVIEEGQTQLLYERLPEAINQVLEEFLLRGITTAILDWRFGSLKISDKIQQKLKEFAYAVIVTVCDQKIDADQVIHDRTTAYKQVVTHFVKTGRKRPALMTFGYPENDINIEAFISEAASLSTEILANNLIFFDTDYLGRGLSIAEKTLVMLKNRFGHKTLPFDCVLCANDESALTLLCWLRAKKIRVPEDIAVVGFNNTDASLTAYPPLASINRNDERLAETVKELVLAHATENQLPAKETIRMEFVHRASAG